MFDEAAYGRGLVSELLDRGLLKPLAAIVKDYAICEQELAWCQSAKNRLILERGAGGARTRVLGRGVWNMSKVTRTAQARLMGTRPLQPGQAVRLLLDHRSTTHHKKLELLVGLHVDDKKQAYAGNYGCSLAAEHSSSLCLLPVENWRTLQWLQIEHVSPGAFRIETKTQLGEVRHKRVVNEADAHFYLVIELAKLRAASIPLFAIDILNPDTPL